MQTQTQHKKSYENCLKVMIKENFNYQQKKRYIISLQQQQQQTANKKVVIDRTHYLLRIINEVKQF